MKLSFVGFNRKKKLYNSFILASAKGKITSMTEEGCNCPGGAVGACFGDGFTRLNPNIHLMLSQGLGDKAPIDARSMVKEGERFFCDSEIGMKWRMSMPFSKKLIQELCLHHLVDGKKLALQFSIYFRKC